jgi:SAM-dependent methyltransferase
MKRESCGSCHSTDLIEVLDLGTSPLADEFPHSAAGALEQKRYPLGLVTCAHCSLLQLTEIVDDNELWGGDYGFYTSSSWVAVQQQHDYADDLLWRYRDQVKGLVLEIACNDGSMLSRFKQAGCRTLCVDPAAGPAAKARQSGLDVIVKGFGRAVASQVLDEHGYADLVVANNVIAHVADLDDFVAGLAMVMSPEGRLVVEFQYAADLITGNMIDHVYHEHRSFFSLSSLNYALGRHGLKALDVQQTVPQGGSLRVHIGRVNDEVTSPNVTLLLLEEKWMLDPGSLAGMQGRANRIRHRLLELLWDQLRAGRRVAGYGASAKSTTLLNFCEIGPDLVQYFVDSTPMKHGRFTPGTGIPIIDPRADSRAPDTYLLTVHNYTGPIMRRETTFTGQWLIPIPLPVLL